MTIIIHSPISFLPTIALPCALQSIEGWYIYHPFNTYLNFCFTLYPTYDTVPRNNFTGFQNLCGVCTLRFHEHIHLLFSKIHSI